MMSPSAMTLPAIAPNKVGSGDMGASLSTALPCLVITNGSRVSAT